MIIEEAAGVENPASFRDNRFTHEAYVLTMTQTDAETNSDALRIMGRKNRLPSAQRKFFDRIFHSGGGNVLDFSVPAMAEWFEENFALNIFQERFQIEGASKGKTLRGFVAVAEPRLVAKILRALWHYRCSLDGYMETDPSEEARLKVWLDQFTRELDNAPSLNLEDALPDFSGDTTLRKLRASIAADLVDEKPDVALDRVHTYCVKRFRELLLSREQNFDARTPLHAIFGAYGKALRDEGGISAFVLPMLRVQHKLFESLNDARNERSFAHDNELLAVSEAQFIVDSVLASLAFIERLETARKADLSEPDDSIPF